jgi:TPR repeat protein
VNLGIVQSGLGQQEEAVRWYEQAANQGDSSAQNLLGLALHQGLGVEQVRSPNHFPTHTHTHARTHICIICTDAGAFMYVCTVIRWGVVCVW